MYLSRTWLWMSQSCFSLGFLSQNPLWKLLIFRGYKGYLYWSEKGMRRVNFSIVKWTSDLTSRLDWVASPSHELIEWSVWTFCHVVLQLVWRFSFSTYFTCVHLLVTCKLQATREIQPRVPVSLRSLEHFFTLSHTLPLHDSHLNTGLQIAKLQANLV